MLLRDSEVANEIKKKLGIPVNTSTLIRKELKFKNSLDLMVEQIRGELKKSINSLPYTDAYKDICKAIDCLTIYESQFCICNNKYRIDFYFKKLNLAIEYDEKYHNSQKYEDKKRQDEIIRDIYIDKYYLGITQKELKEWGYKNKIDLYEDEKNLNNLEYSFDLTEFIRVEESYEIKNIIKITTMITSKINKILDNRGMSCNYKDLIT